MLQPLLHYLNRHGVAAMIEEPPAQQLGIVVCIPAFKEPDPLLPLDSLFAANPPSCSVEVLILFNTPEQANSEELTLTREGYQQTLCWAKEHRREGFSCHPILVEAIPRKHAGAGMARKIVMDQAVIRFLKAGNSRGILAGFDSDTTCCPNYFCAIEEHFARHPQTGGASVYFEHPLSGTEFSPQIYQGIVQYESHLRYLSQAMRYCGFPYFYHTVGSAFTVRADIYALQGGMNRRTAGEDFYFLHKIMPLQHYAHIHNTTVYPSPRCSDRVPFGTGAQMRHWMEQAEKSLDTYAFESFRQIKPFFEQIPLWYAPRLSAIPATARESAENLLTGPFLEQEQWFLKWQELQTHSSSPERFTKRFFNWFNGFMMVKYLNYCVRSGLVKQPVQEACSKLAEAAGWENFPQTFPQIVLRLREEDKKIG